MMLSSALSLALASRGGGGPSYNLSFLSSTLDPSLTFTRASSAWYTNSAGVLTQATNNVPRFDYSPSTLQLNGLLIEQQSTNLVLNSNGLYTGWSGSAATVTQNQATSPDGTTNASLLSWTNAAGWWSSAATAVAAGSVTLSFWARSVSGTQPFYLQLSQSPYPTSPLFTATTTWQRFTFTTTATAGTGGFGIVWSGYATGSLYIYGAQEEQLGFATSYIPTTSSTVTRAADSLVNTNIGGWFNAAQGTMFLEFIEYPYTASYALLEINDGSTSNRHTLLNGSGPAQYYACVGGAAVSNINTGTIGTLINTKIGASYIVGASALSLSGGAVVTGSPASLPAVNTLRIGSTLASASPMSGWLVNFSYYNTALTNTQLKTISGQL